MIARSTDLSTGSDSGERFEIRSRKTKKKAGKQMRRLFIQALAATRRLCAALILATIVCCPASAQSPAPPAAAQAVSPQQTEPQAPAVAPASEPIATPGTAAALLPRDLSPWGMFLNADTVVKVVMIGLVLASLVTWTVALAKSQEILSAKRRLRVGLRAIGRAPSLHEAGKCSGIPEDLSALVR